MIIVSLSILGTGKCTWCATNHKPVVSLLKGKK